jgi:hypothetical protein
MLRWLWRLIMPFLPNQFSKHNAKPCHEKRWVSEERVHGDTYTVYGFEGGSLSPWVKSGSTVADDCRIYEDPTAHGGTKTVLFRPVSTTKEIRLTLADRAHGSGDFTFWIKAGTDTQKPGRFFVSVNGGATWTDLEFLGVGWQKVTIPLHHGVSTFIFKREIMTGYAIPYQYYTIDDISIPDVRG